MRLIKDFKNGLHAVKTVIAVGGTLTGGLSIAAILSNDNTLPTIALTGISVVAATIIATIPAFIQSYVPLMIGDEKLSVPATDQIRTFTDILILNPFTGYFRRREYNLSDIEQATSQYTYKDKIVKERNWSIVITGTKNGQSFSQNIKLSNQQSRTEALNAIRQTIGGKTSAEFSY